MYLLRYWCMIVWHALRNEFSLLVEWGQDLLAFARLVGTRTVLVVRRVWEWREDESATAFLFWSWFLIGVLVATLDLLARFVSTLAF